MICDGFTVDHNLEVSSQPNVARIPVKGCRRPRCRKLTVEDSVIEKIAAKQFVCAKGDVWRLVV